MAEGILQYVEEGDTIRVSALETPMEVEEVRERTTGVRVIARSHLGEYRLTQTGTGKVFCRENSRLLGLVEVEFVEEDKV